jgi:hypothetical protein
MSAGSPGGRMHRLSYHSQALVSDGSELAFTMVSKKVNNCDKWMKDKHADYPPSSCLIGNPFINGRVNNHPYFKSENQYSNYKDGWQPCT